MTSEIQAVLFDKKKWAKGKASRWLQMHNFRPIKDVHITGNFLRYRLRNPKKFKRLRIKHDPESGVSLIIGFMDRPGGEETLRGHCAPSALVPGRCNERIIPLYIRGRTRPEGPQ